MTERPSAFSPLTHRTFRWLWIALSVSTIGLWMEALGAQWFLVSQPGGGALVALVQTALVLPMALLALPSGVLADNMNRRRLLIIVQSATLVVGITLTVLMALDRLNPLLLLTLTALLGCGGAMTLTPYQSLIPELVSKERVPPAAALTGVGANMARIIGPAIAGLLVAFIGIAAVFALNAVLTAFFLVVLIRWRGDTVRRTKRERFWPAMRSGVRYVRYSPQVLKLMLRSFLFTAPMMAIFALLPLVATERLGLDSSGYGALFAALGAGAVIGGISIARLRRTMTTNAIVTISVVLAATATAVLPFVTNVPAAFAIIVLAGFGWTAALAAIGGALQVYLPAWVRARGLALTALSQFGGQAIGSVVVGFVADVFGLTTAFVGSAIVMFIGAALAWWLPIHELDHVDRTPTQHWPEPDLIVDPDDFGGEVAVLIEYWIKPEDEEQFLWLMEHIRRIRLRTGGMDWRLLKDGEVEHRFVEQYSVATWEEHEAQHHGRLVASDQVMEDQVEAMSDPPRTVQHLFRMEVRDSSWNPNITPPQTA